MHQVAEQPTDDPHSVVDWDDADDEEYPVKIKVAPSKTTMINGFNGFVLDDGVHKGGLKG